METLKKNEKEYQVKLTDDDTLICSCESLLHAKDIQDYYTTIRQRVYIEVITHKKKRNIIY